MDALAGLQRQDIEELKKELAYEMQQARDLSHLVKRDQYSSLRQQKQRQEEILLQLRREYKDRVSQTSSKQLTERSSRCTHERSHSFKSSVPRPFSKQFSRFRSHLERVLELQQKAKELLLNDTPQENPPQNNKLSPQTLRKLPQAPVPLKLAVYVRESEFRRANNLPPRVTYKTTRTGEVFPLHVVGNPAPADDPLVKVETQVFPQTRSENSASLIAHAQTLRNSEESTLTYTRQPRSPPETTPPPRRLTKAPRQREIHQAVPMTRFHSFRDLQKHYEPPPKPVRRWVSQRMRVYMSERVNKDFQPKPSKAKELELVLRNYKQGKPKGVSRVRLSDL